VRRGPVHRVWLTAESLGDDDPALAAHPDLPAVFVFDEALLARLRLTGKRLVFLAECLADLAQRREVQVFRGDPVEVLRGGGVATTYAPVPGWRRRSALIGVDEVHPWPWLVRPHGGPAGSFSAWRKVSPRRAVTAPARSGSRSSASPRAR
jgi:deoxyribodipyrimidine photo-lyase